MRHLLSLITIACFCCTPVLDENFDSDRADSQDPIQRLLEYQENPLEIQLPEPFDYCPESTAVVQPEDRPQIKSSVDFGNASWLSFLSGNQYAHFARLSILLEQMGFGNPGEGKWWEEQARTFVTMREDEEAGLVPLGTSAKFKKELLQTVRPGSKMQFFSDGEIVENEFVRGSTQVGWFRHSTLPLVLIVFRGTEVGTLSDLLVDVNVATSQVVGWGMVHDGFWAGWTSVRDLILQKTLADGAGTNLWVSGHSLGGALALLATTELTDLRDSGGFEIGGVYTFGQPRVGDRSFAKAMYAAANGSLPGSDGVRGTRDDVPGATPFSLIRFRNADDVITQSPPTSIGYRHGGTLVHLPAYTTDTATYFHGSDLGDTESQDGPVDDHVIVTDLKMRFVPAHNQYFHADSGRISSCSSSQSRNTRKRSQISVLSAKMPV